MEKRTKDIAQHSLCSIHSTGERSLLAILFSLSKYCLPKFIIFTRCWYIKVSYSKLLGYFLPLYCGSAIFWHKLGSLVSLCIQFFPILLNLLLVMNVYSISMFSKLKLRQNIYPELSFSLLFFLYCPLTQLLVDNLFHCFLVYLSCISFY